MHVLQEIRRLKDAELFSDLRLVAGIILSSSCGILDTSLSSKVQKYEIMVYFADSLCNNNEYIRAEKVYKEALQLRSDISFQFKSQNKGSKNALSADNETPPPLGNKSATSNIPQPPSNTSMKSDKSIPNISLASLPESLSEVEVKFRLYKCYLKHSQNKDALLVLETITNRKRNGKINLALAQLYENSAQDRAATQCYKEVLKDFPYSLEAAQGLIRLGVKGTEVASLVQTSLQEIILKKTEQVTEQLTTSPEHQQNLPPQGYLSAHHSLSAYTASSSLYDGDWLSFWIKGQASLHSGDFNAAIASFESLSSRPSFRNSVHILVDLGQSQYLQGDYDNAKSTYEGVRCIEPYYPKGMDQLANLLFKAKLYKDLETLATSLMDISDQLPEAWVAMGYVCRAQKKNKRAIYFAQKAYSLKPRNVEALILKGMALMDIKRVDDAVVHFREALRLSPKRFEAHHGLIGCYLNTHRNREAISQAKEAFNALGQSARSLTLYGTVLAKEPLHVDKAKSYLERALRVDHLHTAAVYPLAEIHASLREYEKGADLLRKQLVLQSTGKLHQVLGDFLSQLKEYQEALDQYSIALSLDPSNARALEGIQRVEKASDGGTGSSAAPPTIRTGGGTFEDMEGLDSDNEAELSDGPEGAPGEWSDTDFS